jgi:uncharacterized protein
VSTRHLLDTGPLVALLNRRDKHHDWAAVQWAQASPPLLTCEPVLTEACFLLRASPNGSSAVMELLRRRAIEIAFHVADHIEPLARLMRKYADVPMSLADACLVRMAELLDESAVITFDRDFRIYRKSGRQIVPAIMPDDL